jgi:hypothetical protein
MLGRFNKFSITTGEVVMLTQHAKVRMQQRSIPPLAVEIFERFASTMRRDGAEVLYFDKAARKRVAKAFGGHRGCRAVEKWLDAYVVNDNGVVITVAHRTRRLKRNR